ncbi:MAG: ribonuclease P protein component [Candidatus Omnitrophica bacterium]|nr:ribonuclease P protein component [Candidatus Omnitrophota bacterium]
MNERLLSSQRIAKPKAFEMIFKKGNRIQGRLLNVWVYRSRESQSLVQGRPKLAIMVSRKAFAKAVQRNLWKRRFREIFRTHQNRLLRGVSLIVQAKRQNGVPGYEALHEEVESLFEKAKILA